MSELPRPAPAADPSELVTRARAVGRLVGEREAAHAEGLARARARAEALRAEVARALEGFHASVREAGAPYVEIGLSPVRIDDKHLRAVEFELWRGRHRAIVVAKGRGEVTLVGPFRSGKTEGPCKSFPMDAGDEIDRALVGFLERFLEEAATP